MRDTSIVKVSCDWCGYVFGKYAEKVTAHNFCRRHCLWTYYSRRLGRKVGPRTRVYVGRGAEHSKLRRECKGKKEVTPNEV